MVTVTPSQIPLAYQDVEEGRTTRVLKFNFGVEVDHLETGIYPPDRPSLHRTAWT